MRKLIYMFSVSADGFISAPGDDIAWSAPADDLHRFYNEQTAELDTLLYGRKMYQLMEPVWPTADQEPDASEVVVEFSRLYRRIQKVVFSRTLTSVSGNSRLATDDVGIEVERLKALPGRDMGVGGATLAAECMRLGLIDEYRQCIFPVVLGAGTRYFAPVESRIALRPLETRAFSRGVTYLRYGVVRDEASDPAAVAAAPAKKVR